MARKKRSDSNSAAIEVTQTILEGAPKPPDDANVPPEMMGIWYQIINTKDYSTWTPNDLLVAAELTRVTYDIEDYSKLVSNRRRIVKDGDKLAISPIQKLLTELNTERMALCRTLQIHARATHGESQHQTNRNLLFFENKRNIQENVAQSLIAMPNRKQ